MRFTQMHFLLPLLQLCNAAKSCHSRYQSDLDDCSSDEGYKKRLKQRDMNKVTNNMTINSSQGTCQYTNACKRIFKVARFHRLSFSPTISIELANMLQICCGNCTKYSQEWLNPPLEKVNLSVLESFDIIYPVYAQSSLKEMHEFHFIPVLNIPGAYYFTLHMSDRVMFSKMATAVWNMWPLLAYSLVLCALAGFIIWILDTWSNRSEFPRGFLTGVREGFWWGFVSMTTVGYGDKVPKSQAGRAFAVVWILAGIAINTIFTARLISDVTSVQDVKDPPLDDQRVGILENRMHDLAMVSQHRGIIRQFPYNDTIFGMTDMIESLAAGDINGFLVSVPTYLYFSRNMKKPDKEDYWKSMERIRNIRLDQWEKDFRSERLVAGMLVKSTSHYNFFRKFIESNWLKIQVCYSLHLTNKYKKLEDQPSSTMDGTFVYFCYTALWILLGVLCFGVVFEWGRRKNWIRCDTKKDEDEVDNESNRMSFIWNTRGKDRHAKNNGFEIFS